MDLQLAGRAYLVTGGSGGLGRATAEALVGDGAHVLISGRTEESLRRTADELGDLAHWQVADNADPSAAERLVEAALALWGRLDGVLISVGGPPPGSATEVGDDQWRGAFESVFLGAVRLARTAAAAMTEPGSITFVLSTSVKAPVGGLAISNGLRPGLAMVAKDLANELGPRGIRVNALLPGRIATDRVAQLDAATGDADAARESSQARIPLRRYGRPDEFGRAAAFVMSPAASYLSGVVLPVDGGMVPSL